MQNPLPGLLLVISFSSIKSRPFWSHAVEPIIMTIRRMMGEERGRNGGAGVFVCVRVRVGVGVCVVLGGKSGKLSQGN